jgi:chromosome segregation ATPase
MRKFTTVLAAMLLALSMMAMPAMADGSPEYLELEQALANAQDKVDAAQETVNDLKDDIADAQADVDVQQEIVDDLKDDLRAAEAELKLAEDRLAELTKIRAACAALATNPERNQCRNPTNSEFNELSDTTVPDLSGVVAGIKRDVDGAVEVLEDLQEVVDGLVVELGDEDSGALKELADAIIARDAAQEALDAYVPPTAEVHPGCKGITNAQAKVSKGNAPAALAAVAEKLKCAA